MASAPAAASAPPIQHLLLDHATRSVTQIQPAHPAVSALRHHCHGLNPRRLLSSTTRRGGSPKPDPAPAPKEPAGETEAKPNADLESRRSLGKREFVRRIFARRPLDKILLRIFRERDPEKLVSKFIAASTASPPFGDIPRVYEVAVARLASAGRQDAVAAILDSQKPFLVASSVDFAARLIHLYGRASMPSHAAATFRDLPSKHKSVVTFNALLDAYMSSGDLDALATAFQEIPASHPTIVPNVYSYNMLIRVLCKKPDLSAAVDAIAVMEECGLAPDMISFKTILDGLYNKGCYDDLQKVWAMMKERNVEPSTENYNVKLHVLVAEGRIGDAVAVIERMRKDGPKPDAASYNELIRAYCKEGKLDEAKKVYGDLVNNECAPNKGTFQSLVPHLVEAGELDLSIKCCHEIISRNCRVKCSLLQKVVTALVAASRVEEAQRIVELGGKNCRWNNLKMPQCTRENKELKMPPSTREDNVVEAEDDIEEGCMDEKDSKTIVTEFRGQQQGIGSRNMVNHLRDAFTWWVRK